MNHITRPFYIETKLLLPCYIMVSALTPNFAGMNKTGPIILIEDDLDDLELIIEIFKEIKVENKVHSFSDGIEAYEFLNNFPEQPFLILSDINMPKLNGFELRDKIHNNEQLNLKCIPYLFFTTSAEQKMVVEAYSNSVQGFFVKPSNYNNLKRILTNIVEYWKDCHSPRLNKSPKEQ